MPLQHELNESDGNNLNVYDTLSAAIAGAERLGYPFVGEPVVGFNGCEARHCYRTQAALVAKAWADALTIESCEADE